MANLKLYLEPDKKVYAPLFERALNDDRDVEHAVLAILNDVETRGDEALKEYELKFDSSRLDNLFVTDEEFETAEAETPDEVKTAIEVAYANIEKFHQAQKSRGEEVETTAGVKCSRIIVPIEKVGLYVPGGTSPLFSTVLMLAIPAKVAGCGEVILATPSKQGVVNPVVLYAAKRCGIKKVLKAGGAQAIAALAYGTESVPKADKIFGPGNRYVSFAKRAVSSVTAIDMVAGPSEVMVVADRNANPLYVATDLLSQAEHGKDSQVVLVIRADDESEALTIFSRIDEEITRELEKLGRKEYMLPSLSHSLAFAAYSDEKALEYINAYAPEHLIINTAGYRELVKGVRNAGSVFLGPYSPESAGDYASGTNHTLPTSGQARAFSGLSLDSFIKKITVQELTSEGIRSLAPSVIAMAEAEELTAHADAARVRCL